MEIKAKFAALNIKQGKSVVQFELDEAQAYLLPDLSRMAGSQVIISVTDPQQVINYPVEAEDEQPGLVLYEDAL